MEEKSGLVKGIECKYVKIQPEVAEAIAARIGLDVQVVRGMLRYNIFTINQFSKLSGLSVSHILNKTRPSVINGEIGTELDYCYPFNDSENEGPKFIVRNEKSEKYLKV